MAKVLLPSGLLSRTGGVGGVDVGGRTVGDVLTALERSLPGVRGSILDESGSVRRRVALYIEGNEVSLGHPVADDSRIHVVGRIGWGRSNGFPRMV